MTVPELPAAPPDRPPDAEVASAPSRRPPWRVIRTVALVVGVAVFFGLFAIGVKYETRQNQITSANDQGSYSDYVLYVKTRPHSVLYNRNRMPLLPYLTSFTVGPKATRRDAFKAGRRVNILIALVGCVGVALWTRRYAGDVAAVAMTLLVAFTVFLFKAPFIQSELLFYLLFALAAWGMWECLRRPRPMLAAATGVVAALAHLTKNGVLPMIALFGLWSLLAAAMAWRRRDRSRARAQMGALGAVALLFVLTAAPYLQNSKRLYGSYFYNVNTTYYAWYDSWDQVATGTFAHGDEAGRVTLPASQLPSLPHYLRDHSLHDIVQRLRVGFKQLRDDAQHGYGFWGFVVAEWAVLGGLAVYERRRVWAQVRRLAIPLAFLASTAIVLVAGWSWWMAISRGNRFILTLFLPAVLGPAVAINRLGRHLPITIGTARTNAADVFFGATAVRLAFFAYTAAFTFSHRYYGGY